MKVKLSELSAALKQLRIDFEVKLRELSEDTGLSISYLSDLERGRGQMPSIRTLQKLATYYDTTIELQIKASGTNNEEKT